MIYMKSQHLKKNYTFNAIIKIKQHKSGSKVFVTTNYNILIHFDHLFFLGATGVTIGLIVIICWLHQGLTDGLGSARTVTK